MRQEHSRVPAHCCIQGRMHFLSNQEGHCPNKLGRRCHWGLGAQEDVPFRHSDWKPKGPLWWSGWSNLEA